MAGSSYATASRKKMLGYLRENKARILTAAEIHAYLRSQNSEVNITTIYRYLDKLEKDGAVMKYTSGKGNQAAYQYVEAGLRCGEHLHLTCVDCGCVIHLDCAFMDEISEHIASEHGFMLQCQNSILYGVCEKCRAIRQPGHD